MMAHEYYYQTMWFDGEFPENLKNGWQNWDTLRAIHLNDVITPFEKEIHYQLALTHGMSYVEKGVDFYEIYTFDTEHPGIYTIDKSLLLHFILYFKEEAKKIIAKAEHEKIRIKDCYLAKKNKDDKRVELVYLIIVGN